MSKAKQKPVAKVASRNNVNVSVFEHPQTGGDIGYSICLSRFYKQKENYVDEKIFLTLREAADACAVLRQAVDAAYKLKARKQSLTQSAKKATETQTKENAVDNALATTA